MKTLFYLILSFTFVSCCVGNRKCAQDYNSARFRIISIVNENDLVFGPSKIYDKNSIKFFSLSGTDTIFHHYGAGPNPNPGEDSLLFVDFDYRKKETVYIKLNNADIDTIVLAYQTIDASPCCPDYLEGKPISCNNNFLQQLSGGITIIKK
jgi:hypothetical protein